MPRSKNILLHHCISYIHVFVNNIQNFFPIGRILELIHTMNNCFVVALWIPFQEVRNSHSQ